MRNRSERVALQTHFQRRSTRARLILAGACIALASVASHAERGLPPAAEGFARIPEFVGERPCIQAAEQRVLQACQIPSSDCFAFLRRNRELARQAVPDNPDYWHAYERLLTPALLAREPQDVGKTRLSSVVNATRDWTLNEVLVNGAVDPTRFHTLLTSHRQLLGEANFLIDKAIFTATTGILLSAANVVLAEGGVAADVATMIPPFSIEEIAFARVVEGELAYAEWMIETNGGPVPDLWPEWTAIHRQIAEFSSLPPSQFWWRGIEHPLVIDWAAVGFGGNPYETWRSYLQATRLLDVHRTLVMALATQYIAAAPGLPADPPPAGWEWRWDTNRRELCLAPADMHQWHGEQPELCEPYLR